ncbi:MAG: DUF3995 domain-containing protein [Thermomicrobiales bacterium]
MANDAMLHREKEFVNERTKERAGMLVAAILAGDGLLHAYWTTGAVWPAHDSRAVMRAVLNSDQPVRPIVVGPLACLLLLAALTALARVHRLGRFGRLIPDRVLQFGILVITAGALARGVAGIGMALRGNAGTTFYRLNVVLYTPACLALFVAALAAARAERSMMTWCPCEEVRA